MTDRESPPIRHAGPPDYARLLSWWDAWPEARPELLDFWARGNFSTRILSRRDGGRSACIVRARYLDEMDAAVRRLALLDLDIDVAWCGDTAGPAMAVVPQDIDYEGAGGWGYLVAAGDTFSERRGGKEWCPSLAWASLLPDTVTDWVADHATALVRTGHLMISPAQNVGLQAVPGRLSEHHLQIVSESKSVVRRLTEIETLFELELPYLERMSLRDVAKFCEDHEDSLVLFQSALRKLLIKTTGETSEVQRHQLLSEIRDGVAELRLSDRTKAARKTLTALGGSISTFLVTIGVQLGIPPGVVATASTGAAMATLAQWAQVLELEGAMRKNPFYILWKLQKGTRSRMHRHERPFLEEVHLPSAAKPKQIPPYHELAPPTGGWVIPSGFRRE